MKHLGDICQINGAEIAPVDVVVGGSPCQDLSVAGRQTGLAGERSGLFMEQIRIIKEMRAADEQRGNTAEFIRPRFMVWENVPGAFNSNQGEDFRIVLEETAKIVQPDAAVPEPPKGKWSTSGCIMGRGWSIAWRVLDAQFWGVPQRRRRIVLVADFGGEAAPEILFERQSLLGDIEPSAASGQTSAAGTGAGASAAGAYCLAGNMVDRESRQNGTGIKPDIAFTLTAVDRHAVCAGFDYCMGAKAGNIGYQEECAPTLTADKQMAVFENHGQDGRYTGPLDVSPVCSRHWGTGGNNIPLVVATGQVNAEILQDISPTLNCNHEQPIIAEAYQHQNYRISETVNTLTAGANSHIRGDTSLVLGNCVRRLTPLECERLQGYPDGWTDIGAWHDGKGKLHKESSDTSRYKALGNSIALPPWRWVLLRLAAQYYRPATMGSLFDGIGGFPLIWESINGQGSCLWASEVDEFCIAVTKRRFEEG